MIQSKVLQVTDVVGRTNTVRGFSDIRFTCDGIISKWIVGTNDVTGNTLPNIQLLRSDMTVITSLTVDTNNGISTDTNVYEFTSLLNAEVKTGDILVVNSTDIPVYYQRFNGPQNYMIDSSNTLVEVVANNYPLISVEFVKGKLIQESTKRNLKKIFFYLHNYNSNNNNSNNNDNNNNYSNNNDNNNNNNNDNNNNYSNNNDNNISVSYNIYYNASVSCNIYNNIVYSFNWYEMSYYYSVE